MTQHKLFGPMWSPKYVEGVYTGHFHLVLNFTAFHDVKVRVLDLIFRYKVDVKFHMTIHYQLQH